MAKTGSSHDKNLAINRLVLTGDSKNDWALWQLSLILAEIAEHSIRNETSEIDVDGAQKGQIGDKISAEHTANGAEDGNDA